MRSLGERGVSYETGSSPTVYLERSNNCINNTFSTADESCGSSTNSFDEVTESLQDMSCSRILFKKREKALQKMRRLRKDRLKANSQAPSQSLEPQPRAKTESRRAAKVKAALSKRNKWRNATTEQPTNVKSSNIKQVSSVKAQSTSIAGRKKFVERPVDVSAQICHSPGSTVGTLPSSHGLEIASPCSNDAAGVNSPCLGVPFVGDINDEEPVCLDHQLSRYNRNEDGNECDSIPDDHVQPSILAPSLIQSVSSVSDSSELPLDEEDLGLFDGLLSSGAILETPWPLATPYSLKNELDVAGRGRRLCPQSLSREILGLNLRGRKEGPPDLQLLQVEDRAPDEVDF